jgi:hypothetical protein
MNNLKIKTITEKSTTYPTRNRMLNWMASVILDFFISCCYDNRAGYFNKEKTLLLHLIVDLLPQA